MARKPKEQNETENDAQQIETTDVDSLKEQVATLSRQLNQALTLVMEDKAKSIPENTSPTRKLVPGQRVLPHQPVPDDWVVVSMGEGAYEAWPTATAVKGYKPDNEIRNKVLKRVDTAFKAANSSDGMIKRVPKVMNVNQSWRDLFPYQMTWGGDDGMAMVGVVVREEKYFKDERPEYVPKFRFVVEEQKLDAVEIAREDEVAVV